MTKLVTVISIKKPDLKFILSLLILFLLPNFFYVMLSHDSLAQGLMIASLAVIVINFNNIMELKSTLSRLIIYISIIALLFFFAIINYINYEISKPVLSLLVLLFVFFSSSVFSVKLNKICFEALESSLLLVILFLLCLGWLKIFLPITVGAYSALTKPVFPFIEESFYALSVSLLSVGYAVTARKTNVFFIIINMFLLSIMFPSLTMMLSAVLTLFASMIRLRTKYFKALLFVSPLILILTLNIFLMDNTYFSSRLSFEDSKNVTTLVFLQGWSLAFENFISTKGFGLGFQMLGMPGTQLTQFSDMIERIAGSTLNLTDGGLLAAKFIAEFGMIGLIVSLVYVVFIIKFLFNANAILNKTRCRENNFLLKRCLLQGLLFGFIVEYFFRGYGYFSPGLYLVVAVLISNVKTDVFRTSIYR